MNAHPNELGLTGGDLLTGESHEIARIWVTNNAGSSVWINAGLIADPHVFGFLMADTIRHAAKAYAGTYGMDEGKALQAIVDGVGEELREQVNTVTTLQAGSLN